MPKDMDRVAAVRLSPGGSLAADDRVVVEEPLQIRIDGDSAFVTMRTPGDDMDLAAGFLLTDGWISSAADIGTLAYCPDESHPSLRNTVEARLAAAPRRPHAPRAAWASSSCGLCGAATLESIRQNCQPVNSSLRLGRDVITGLPAALRRRQVNFGETGGIHAAGLFDAAGEAIAIREDIGRHNAVDKAVGAALRSDGLGRAAVLMVSGRLGFEIAQKALMARVPVVASVSAASSLALELAAEFGLTAIGFLRGETMNVYTCPERVL